MNVTTSSQEQVLVIQVTSKYRGHKSGTVMYYYYPRKLIKMLFMPITTLLLYEI